MAQTGAQVVYLVSCILVQKKSLSMLNINLSFRQTWNGRTDRSKRSIKFAFIQSHAFLYSDVFTIQVKIQLN